MDAFFQRLILQEWRRTSVWQIGLRPLSWLFALLIAVRRALYRSGVLRSTQVGVPLVVVGNINVGGTGKTPLVLALCERFRAAHPGVVSRGYRNADEAALTRARAGVPVVTNPDRVAAARSLHESHPDTALIIADDGMQHYRLARDIEIAVVDAEAGFGNGCLLPAGPLREPVSRLAAVDCIVLNMPQDLPSPGGENTSNGAVSQAEMAETAHQIKRLQSQLAALGRPVFSMRLGKARFRPVSVATTGDAETAEAFVSRLRADRHRVAAVAGIGRPARFFAHLESLGVQLVSRHAFDDHHDYTEQELAAIDADIILMTEKDAVKCRDFGAVAARLWMMQVDAVLPEAFFEFIDARLSSNRARRSQTLPLPRDTHGA